MKRALTLLFSLALVVGLALAAHAGEVVKGKVVSIDVAGKTIVIDTTEGQKTLATQGEVKGVKPGMEVEVTCIDVGGKACAKDVKIVHPARAAKPKVMEGEVVSIDPEGKAVVIKTSKGKEMKVPLTEGAKVEKITVNKGAAAGEQVTVQAATVKELAPGEKVTLECMDVSGKFCANKITVVPNEPLKAQEVTGKVVSIDSTGNSVVIKTKSGEKTLYYQKTTQGTPLSGLEVGKRIKAYCLDVEGKSCIKDINTVK